MIDALRRLGDEIYDLINEEQYFIIHAARQTGKTTLLLELTKQINKEGQYYALYCSLENVYGITGAKEGIPAVIYSLEDAIESYDFLSDKKFGDNLDYGKYPTILQKALRDYCRSLDKPLIIFFDEADCLSEQTLISFLRQLRNGFINRSTVPFVHSLGLIGMRSIRDYRNRYRSPEETLGSASPFNIVKSTLNLRNFTKDEILELYSQHTKDTGQIFDDEAIEFIWQQTQGQPWLVNAIACEIVRVTKGEKPQKPVNILLADTAIQTLILKRDTHFDSLMARLTEKRIKSVIEPIITGEAEDSYRFSDDYLYTKDMGLIRDDRGKVEPANPIYTEVIIRSLNWDTQCRIEQSGSPYQIPRYLKDGVIDMDYLFKDFQVFWRENAAIWQEKYEYKEAAPHLVLQAFLQRIINGGGQLIREMAAETKRVDLCVIYQKNKYPIELKIRYDKKTLEEGLEQTTRYMDTLGCDIGWLVLFDRRKTVSWEKKLYTLKEKLNGKTITVIGC
jgi:hypothetical protein